MKTRKPERKLNKTFRKEIKKKKENQKGNENRKNRKQMETRKPERSLNKIIKLNKNMISKLNKRHNKSFKRDILLF